MWAAVKILFFFFYAILAVNPIKKHLNKVNLTHFFKTLICRLRIFSYYNYSMIQIIVTDDNSFRMISPSTGVVRRDFENFIFFLPKNRRTGWIPYYFFCFFFFFIALCVIQHCRRTGDRGRIRLLFIYRTFSVAVCNRKKTPFLPHIVFTQTVHPLGFRS